MKLKAGIYVAAILGISACGGGGGDSDPPAVPAAQNLQTAPLPAIVWEPNLMVYSGPSATDDNGTWYLMLTSQPGTPNPASFDGLSAYNLSIDLSLNVDGTSNTAFATDNIFYLLNPYMPLGNSDGTQVTSWTPPSSLTVGAAGQLASFSDGSTETYAVTAYSPTAVLMTVTESNGSLESYTVTATGDEQLISVTIPGYGVFTW